MNTLQFIFNVMAEIISTMHIISLARKTFYFPLFSSLFFVCIVPFVAPHAFLFVFFFIYLFHTSFIKCINSLHAEHLIRNKFFVFIFNSAGDASVLLCRFQVSSFFFPLLLTSCCVHSVSLCKRTCENSHNKSSFFFQHLTRNAIFEIFKEKLCTKCGNNNKNEKKYERESNNTVKIKKRSSEK